LTHPHPSRAILRQRGVARLTTPIPWAQAGPVNTYVLLGPPHVVIDTGYAFAWPELSAQLAAADIELGDIATILLTHGHPDHASGAAELVPRSGAKVHLHPQDHPKLAPDYLEVKAEQYLRLRPWFRREGVPDDEFAAYVARFEAPRHRFEVDLRPEPLEDGQRLELPTGPLTVLATPGHTPGHVLFHDEERRLAFSGDHLLAGTSPNPLLDFDEDDRRYRSFPDYLSSLARVRGLDVDLWCPGHGRTIASAPPVIDSLHGFYAVRQAALVEHTGARGATSFELSRALFPDASGLDRFLSLSEIVGHVDALLARGLLAARMRDGRRLLHRR
jgi:glyoxylase-like metal-dependent hydrolase (beta-lactamase superfamily II)